MTDLLSWFSNPARRRPLLRALVAAQVIYILGVAGAGYATTALGKRVRGHLASLPDWLLLLPGFYLPGGLPLAVATLVVLYAHAGSVLARANRDQDPEQLTVGAVLFVAATAVAYFKLTWGFMDKSLFFLLGGVLLLGLSWYLRRRNAQVLAAAGPPVAQQASLPPMITPAAAAPDSSVTTAGSGSTNSATHHS